MPAASEEKRHIVIYGAAGNVGSAFVLEALARGHKVTGVSRKQAKFKKIFKITQGDFGTMKGDITDPASVLDAMTGAAVVIVSVQGVDESNEPENAVANVAAHNLISAARKLGEAAPRILQVGGGSTLYTDDNGNQLFEALPQSFKPKKGSRRSAVIRGHHEALKTYQAATDVKWTVVTPPPGTPVGRRGVRTGKYMLNDGYIEVGDEGFSFATGPQLSIEDLAVAVIDEVERGRYIGKRFSASY